MATRKRKNYEAKGVEHVMDRFKNEVAAELGIQNYEQLDKGDIPARIHGKIGGNMVKKMIELAEAQLREGGDAAVDSLTHNAGTVSFGEGSTGGQDSVDFAKQNGLKTN